jgi:hypothetical protein
MESPEWAMKIKFKSPLPHYVKGGVEFGFFCRICRKHYTGAGQECPWITIPCINHNKQAFLRHEGSDIHRDNCQNDHRADNLDTMIRYAAAPPLMASAASTDDHAAASGRAMTATARLQECPGGMHYSLKARALKAAECSASPVTFSTFCGSCAPP